MVVAEKFVNLAPVPELALISMHQSWSAADGALYQLVYVLRSGYLEAGDRLPSVRRLAEIIGISHVNVRQALEVLIQADVVEVTQGRRGGVIVKDLGGVPIALGSLYPPVPEAQESSLIDAWSLSELTVALEASRHGSREDFDRLKLRLDALETHRDRVYEFSERTVHFHMAAALATRNIYLAQQLLDYMNRIALLSAADRYLDNLTPAGVEETLGHYRELYAAIRDGDDEAIRAVIAERKRVQHSLRLTAYGMGKRQS
jgi:GntR family transcriptional repressor for pyruvate dehydrogenase complex